MRAIEIRAQGKSKGLKRIQASFRKNKIHYFQEALGLGIFMISACLFYALLYSPDSPFNQKIPDMQTKNLIMSFCMGSTAFFIFYSPFTAPSGSHINPAVTLSFLRLGKMDPWDSLFYIIFQILGGLIAVILMAQILGPMLTAAPVHYAVTIPGKYGKAAAAATEFLTALLMMSLVLFSSANEKWKKYTRILSAMLVGSYVLIAGPISGFGMNPARTIASAIPANIYTAIWIYLSMPLTGMLSAAEIYKATLKRVPRS
jgi:aquaporin Z